MAADHMSVALQSATDNFFLCTPLRPSTLRMPTHPAIFLEGRFHYLRAARPYSYFGRQNPLPAKRPPTIYVRDLSVPASSTLAGRMVLAV